MVIAKGSYSACARFVGSFARFRVSLESVFDHLRVAGSTHTGPIMVFIPAVFARGAFVKVKRLARGTRAAVAVYYESCLAFTL
jgi:hypothetical protein